MNVPVAVNWFRLPISSCELAGVTAIETSAASPTVNAPWPVTPDIVALTVIDPAEMVFANPEAEIVATPVFEDDHATDAVMSAVFPSR